MKIASYNILSGGFNGYNFDSKEPERLEVLKRAIKTINADFIGLIDTFRWDSLYSSKDLQEIFGYKKAYCINLNDERLKKLGHNNGITVLTNFGDVIFETVYINNRNAIKAKISFNNKNLNIFSVYLDDLDEETRILQCQELLKNVDKFEDTIITGDLNTFSISELAKTNLYINKFLINNPEFAKKIEPALNSMKKCQVISLLQENNFQNADENSNATFPTKLLPAIFKRPFLRIDYSFCTPNLKIKNFKVLKNQIFEEASDHYPIVFEI